MATRQKILAVDNEAGFLNIMKKLLETTYDVTLATDGERALECVARERPDLILLDWKMPGLDGIEVLTQLKADPATRNVPVIMLSARGEAEELTQGAEAGAAGYLIKPFELEALRTTIQRHLPSRDA